MHNIYLRMFLQIVRHLSLQDAAQKVGGKAGLLGGRSGRAPRGPVRGMRLAKCRICRVFESIKG